jgi:hypothetical protein
MSRTFSPSAGCSVLFRDIQPLSPRSPGERERKQKTDRQDAQHILRLLLKDDFPRIWVASWETEICGNSHRALPELADRVEFKSSRCHSCYSLISSISVLV